MSSTSEQASGYKREAYEASDCDCRLALGRWLMLLGGLGSFSPGSGSWPDSPTSSPSPGTPPPRTTPSSGTSAGGAGNPIRGVVVMAVTVCALIGQTWTRWVGIIAAIISGIRSFLFQPFFPNWSPVLIAVNVIIIWTMVTARLPTPGHQTRRPARQ